MSIATEIQRLSSAKAALAVSIENKGVNVPSTTKLDGYAALVDLIQQGGGEGGGGSQIEDKGVSFVDCDGTVLATYTLAEAQNLDSMPANPPTHDGLTFAGWSKTLQEINALRFNDWICADYNLTEDKLIVHVEIPENNYEFSFEAIGGQEDYTILWGDGSAAETFVKETWNAFPSHVYTASGDYTIKVDKGSGELSVQNGYLVSLKNLGCVKDILIPRDFDLYRTTSATDSLERFGYVGPFQTRENGFVVLDGRFDGALYLDNSIFGRSNIVYYNNSNAQTKYMPWGMFDNSAIHAVAVCEGVERGAFAGCKYLKQLHITGITGGYLGSNALTEAPSLEYVSSYDATGTPNSSYLTKEFAIYGKGNLKEVWFNALLASGSLKADMFDGRYDVKVYLPGNEVRSLPSAGGYIAKQYYYVPASLFTSYSQATNWSYIYALGRLISYNFE